MKQNRNMFKNVLVLVRGNTLAKVIGLLVIPIITRIYNPSDMGVLAVFVSTVVLLLPFTNLKYSIAIPLVKSKKLATDLFQLCIIICFLSSLIISFLIWIYYLICHEDVRSYLTPSYFIMLSICVFFMGCYEVCELWATRNKNFHAISKSKIVQTVIGNSGKIILGLIYPSFYGLIIGHAFTLVSGFLYLAKGISVRSIISIKIPINRYKFLLKRFVDFPLYRLPSQFLLVLGSQLPILYFSEFFDATVTGHLGLAITCLALPISLISQSASQAFYGEISKLGKHHPIKIRNMTTEIIKKMLVISFIPFLCLLLFAPTIFELIFGINWAVSGSYVQVLSFSMLFQFCAAPIVSVLNVYNKQKFYMYINILRALLVVFSLFLSSILDFSIINTLLLYSLLLSFSYLFSISLVYKVLRSNINLKNKTT